MASSLDVRCVLVKDGKHLIGVGLIAADLSKKGKAFCEKIFSELSEKGTHACIKITEDTVNFTGFYKLSFSIQEDDARKLKHLLSGDIPMELRHYPFSNCNFKIVIPEMDAFSYDIEIPQKKE